MGFSIGGVQIGGSVGDWVEDRGKDLETGTRDLFQGMRDSGIGTLDTLGINPAGRGGGGGGGAKEDPRITALRQRMGKEAKDFRSNLGKFKNEKYGMVADAGREELANTTKGIRTAANQRGLLFSGMREGEEANARSRMASILAAQRAEINKEAEELATSKEQSVANVGLAGYDAAIKRADDAYSVMLQNEIQRRKGLAQIGEGVGYGFGAYYGKKAGEKAG